METKQKVFVTIGAAAVVAAAIFGGASLFNSSTQTTASTTGGSSVAASTESSSMSDTSSSDTTTDTSSATSNTASSGSYTDGTYTKTISYTVPHGYSNSITVTMVISGGNITSVSTDNSYDDQESGMYIDGFEADVNSEAAGQSLASYGPSRIGGASLTTEAFAEAIADIRTDATA